MTIRTNVLERWRGRWGLLLAWGWVPIVVLATGTSATSEPRLGTTIVHPVDQALMVYVPAGYFSMGLDQPAADTIAHNSMRSSSRMQKRPDSGKGRAGLAITGHPTPRSAVCPRREWQTICRSYSDDRDTRQWLRPHGPGGLSPRRGWMP